MSENKYILADADIVENENNALSLIASRIKPGATVLDLGVGSGALGRYLKTKSNCTIYGIDNNQKYLDNSNSSYDKLFNLDLDDCCLESLFKRDRFQYVIAADIVEHLRYPEKLIKQLKNIVDPNGQIILSIPNVSYIGVVAELLNGQFQYREYGILDDTHVRFYTRCSIQQLIADCGLNTLSIEPIYQPVHKTEFSALSLETIPHDLRQFIGNRRDAFCYQYIVCAQVKAANDPELPPNNVCNSSNAKLELLGFSMQLYWRNGDEPYCETQSNTQLGHYGKDRQVLVFDLPECSLDELYLRLDFPDIESLLTVHEICLLDLNGRILWQPDHVAQGFTEDIRHNMYIVQNTTLANRAECVITGNDPYSELQFDLRKMVNRKAPLQFRIILDWPKLVDYSHIADSINQQIASEAKQVQTLLGQTREMNAKLKEDMDCLDREYTSCQSENIQLKEEVERLKGEYSFYQSKNNQFINQWSNSISWKITAPLRMLSAFVRRLNAVLRKQTFSFKPVFFSGLEKSSSGGFVWRSNSSDPQIILQMEAAKTFPSGWGRLDIDIDILQHMARSKLYFDLGQGYSEARAIKFILPLQNTNPLLVKFPRNIRNLRFDPADTAIAFNLNSFHFTPLSVGQVFLQKTTEIINSHSSNYSVYGFYNKLIRSLEKRGLRGTIKKLRSLYAMPAVDDNHMRWMSRFYTFSRNDQIAIERHLDELVYQPTISIVMPVYNTQEQWLRAAIESVLGQAYGNWQLCIADDASDQSHIKRVLAEYESSDKRIEVVYRTENGHISAASNTALGMARGEFVAFLDHDDELTADALYEIVVSLNKNPDAKIVYSDEDKIDGNGILSSPHFKSDWNLDLFYGQNYLCHLVAIKRDLVNRVGGFRVGYEGAQDYDLLLRCSAQLQDHEIHHIPRILYHWRAVPGSTALDLDEKDYATQAGINALKDLFKTKNTQVKVKQGLWPTSYRVTFPIPNPSPKVSIIIPSRDGYELLNTCVKSILHKTRYQNYEIVIVDNGSRCTRTLDFFRQCANHKMVRVLSYTKEFNFSAINNFAAKSCSGEILLLLNNDTEVISENWLEEMVSHACRPEVGAVGAKLYFRDTKLQHGGVILGLGEDGVAGHSHKGSHRNDIGYFGRLVLTQNLSAVTAACMAVRKDLYLKMGGLNENSLAVAFNDVDFCLRLYQAGYINVWTPHAELYHYESASRGYEDQPEKKARFNLEKQYMHKTWGEMLANDPYYNPNLSNEFEDFSVACVPRREAAWKYSEPDQVQSQVA